MEICSADPSAAKEIETAEDRVLFAKGDQIRNIFCETLRMFVPVPLQPTRFIVLAVCVIIAILGFAEFCLLKVRTKLVLESNLDKTKTING